MRQRARRRQFTVSREGPWSRTSRRLESRGRQPPVVRPAGRRRPPAGADSRTGLPGGGRRRGTGRGLAEEIAADETAEPEVDRRRTLRARPPRTTRSRSSSAAWPSVEPTDAVNDTRADRRGVGGGRASDAGRPDGPSAGARGRERRAARRHGRRAAGAPSAPQARPYDRRRSS